MTGIGWLYLCALGGHVGAGARKPLTIVGGAFLAASIATAALLSSPMGSWLAESSVGVALGMSGGLLWGIIGSCLVVLGKYRRATAVQALGGPQAGTSVGTAVAGQVALVWGLLWGLWGYLGGLLFGAIVGLGVASLWDRVPDRNAQSSP